MNELHADDIFGPDEAYARRVQLAYDAERAKREARRMLDATERGPVLPLAILTVRERLARPRVATPWRIENWQPAGSRVVLAAQFKAGKTTLTGNLVRCLVDGGLFLGRDRVFPVAGTVAVLDFEMSDYKLDDWYRDFGIEHDDRVIVLPMRGRASSFAITDADVRREWAARLKAYKVAYLVIDCLRPILDALGMDEHREAGQFLVALDALLKDAEIPDAMLVHHMGHAGERSRGDSRLRDWPDVEMRLLRQDDDPGSPRFITAYGRDVDIPEAQLEYDPATRRLTVAGGSRKDAQLAEVLADILGVLTDAGAPQSGRAIKAALADSEHGRDTIDAALKYGARNGDLIPHAGPRNSKLYIPGSGSSVRVSGSVRQCPDDFNGHPVNTSVRVSGRLYKRRTLGHSEVSDARTDDADERI
ncbi:MAG TPA: AAA family ATPase [Vicinamibacterales bacterium]